MATYTESSIKAYAGLDGVRKRPSMYLGERGDAMVFVMHSELVANCVDEYLAGRNNEIYVVFGDNEYIVADSAQGIPVGLHPSEGISTLTLVFTRLHAGGKFDNKAYEYSGGTHGCGAAAVSAVSTVFSVYTCRNKKWYFQEFKCGKPTTDVVQQKPTKQICNKLGHVPSCGTVISFSPDQSIVAVDEKTKASLNRSDALRFLRNLALLNRNLKVTAVTPERTFVFINKEGIVRLLNSRLKNKGWTATSSIFVWEHATLDVACCWANHSSDTEMQGYVNSIHNKDGGKHLEGFYSALYKALLPMKLEREKLLMRDLRFGLVGFLNFRISGGEYSSQTKDRFTSNVAKSVEELLVPALTAFFRKNNVGRSVIRQALLVAKGRDEFKKIVTSAMQIKRSSLPPNLVTSPNAKPDKRVLYIVEGTSALGTAKRARNPDYQEVLPLFGKPPNALKCKFYKLITDRRVQDVLKAMGVDIKQTKANKQTFSVESLRVRNVVILADADEDGKHISLLLVALFYTIMPDLILQGRVLIAQPPLFHAFYRNKHYYGSTFAEVLQQNDNIPKSLVIRSKGLAECSVDILADTSFNPDSAHFVRITMPTAKDKIRTFESVVGAGSEARKVLLGL